MDIIVKKIYWERANLHIEINEKVKETFIFCDKQKYPLEKDNNEIIIAFYNLPHGLTLESGNWKISINGCTLKIDSPMLKCLDDYTRIFKYKKTYAYCVDLSCDDELNLVITTEFYQKNRKPHKDDLSFKRKLLYGVSNIVYKFFHLFSSNRNVLLFSENEDDISVNLEPLKHELTDLNKYNVKVLHKNCFKNKVSLSYRFKEIYYLALARYVFIDNYTPLLTYLDLADNVKLIQVWHAGIGFKSVGYARFGKDGSPHPYKSGHRKNTHVIVDEESLIPIYKEVFGLSENNFYPYGLPRLDNFLDPNFRELKSAGINELFPEIAGKKVILFAPTYRGNGQKEAYYDMDQINQKELAAYCKKNNAVILFKFHPFTNNELEIDVAYREYFIDVNHYKGINDLLYVTDILITDYSSCAYEASLLDIPIVFYRYDMDEYEYQRGIHTANLFKSKTFIAENTSELIKTLNEATKVKRKTILNKERNSCKKIIKEIFGE